MSCTLTKRLCELFLAFSICAGKETKHCPLNCISPDCTLEQTAVRDQTVTGTSSREIRDDSGLPSWYLATFGREGMKLKNADKSGEQIACRQLFLSQHQKGSTVLQPYGKSDRTGKPARTNT